ncbi:hemin ABC transporter substrate-binding protein [Xylophilus sp. Leaf220]|uniref:heme/hemin ABC transporter substrate-binding protein n=1 Tax=Xylophilus sp. Leaf220 TaxID=1735686 RepID=UPI000700B589|nr:ABC transporter substrate-binding protein [Xylophilus sp. Leaf220]KQM68973.1 ABC transporter substrate-binding protein [Xylophilus sp. Leaf220]
MTATFFAADPSRRRWLQALAAAGSLPAWAHAQTAARPRRLVTLGGAITEVVYALGAESLLAGTDTTSLYPDAALKTPKVGYMRQLSAEGLLSLRPDAVIATTEAGPPVVLDQVRSAGVQVELVVADHSWDEVQRKVAAVGRAARRPAEAAALQFRLDAEWAAARAEVQRAARRPRMLFILAHAASPQVAGQGTAADALIRFAGGTNAMQGFDGYRPLTAEAMAGAAPELILTSTQGIDAQGGTDRFWQRPELALTPAYRRRALIALEASRMLGFGPRLPGVVREVHGRALAATA